MERRKHIRYILCFAGLFILLTALIYLNLSVGSSGRSSLSELWAAFSGNGDNAVIIRKIRFPRMAEAAVLGGALSVSGFLLQSFFANPIAGPFVLGISSGAKLTAALAMIYAVGRGAYLGSVGLIFASLAGSALSLGAVLLISSRVKRSSMLVVSGVMIGYICSAVTEFAVTFADDSNIVNLHSWSMGTFAAANNGELKYVFVTVGAALVCTFMLSKPLGAYQLGESYAANMGVNIRLFRLALIVLSSVLSACVTAFAGPVAFVGVAVPHLIKGVFGTAKPIIIIPASFLGGAVFCLFCDLIARTVFAPAELSISAVTSVLGAPVVIWIMLRRGKNGGNS